MVSLERDSIRTTLVACRADATLRILRPDSSADDRLDSAANVEVADHLHPSGLAGLRQIVEDAIHSALVEDSVVAKAPEIELEALELQAHVAGYICDVDGSEI